jgi:hypothetical protein
MVSSSQSSTMIQPAIAPKKTWEDPCILLERDLETQAQGGPPPNGAPWTQGGFLGPLGVYQFCD